MKKLRNLALNVLIAALVLAAPAAALAQASADSCDFNGVVNWFTTGPGSNVIMKVGGLVFIVILTVFGFLKKSMPSTVKDIAIKILGGSPAKP